MKIEIEVSEDDIRSALEHRVRNAIAEYMNYRACNEYIKECVKARWPVHIDTIIADAVGDSQAIKEKITLEVEKTLRRQLNAVIKNAT